MQLEPSFPSEQVLRRLFGVSAALTTGALFAAVLGAEGASSLGVALGAAGGAALGALAVRMRWAFTMLVGGGLVGALCGVLVGRASGGGALLLCAAGPALLATVLFGPALREHRVTLAEGALDRMERVGVRTGGGLAIAGVAAMAAPSAVAVGLGALAFASGVVSLAMILHRDRARAGFLRQVHRGEHGAFRVMAEAEAHGYETLPPLLSGSLTDAVLIRRDDAGVASYRSSAAGRAVARCHLALRDALSPIERRGSAVMSMLGVAVAAAPFAAFLHVHAPPPAPAHLATPMEVAPRCVDARAYFAERLPEDIHGLGRAVLLTRAQDRSIREGEGVLLLVPESGGVATAAMKAAALADARGIPCSDPLALRVEDPVYRSFDVSASLTVGLDASPATVASEAKVELAEIFEPNTRAVYNPHVDFGSEDQKMGWRLRDALQRIPGVTRVRLSLNGQEEDVPLAANEFPRLGTLEVKVYSGR